MELRSLQYFLMIARKENISQAAKALHITQPTLSRQMKELEEEFGKQLFIRGNRKIILTPEGVILKQYAETITSLIDKVESELSKDVSSISGEIFIGAGESYHMRLIMRVISKMYHLYPHVEFRLISGSEQEISYKLKNSFLDFGVFIGPVDLSQYDFIQLPMKEVWGVLMREDSELAQYEYITPQLLRHHPVFVSDQDIVKNELAGWLGGNERKLDIRARYNLINNIVLLVEESGGYAITLDRLVPIENHNDLCFKPLYPQVATDIYIAWKKYHTFSKQAEMFLELLRQEVKIYQENNYE